jgi:inner membrane protein
LLFVPLQVLLLVLGVWLVGRWRNKSWNANEWSWMIGLAFVGGFVHIGMDSWNLYGVHPFWPLDNRWYYGDTIFIVEPLIWMTLIPWMWSESTTRWVRNLLLVAYVLGFVALTALYFRTWWYPVFVCFVALGYAWLVRFRLSSVQRTVVGFSVLAVLVGGFFANSLSTRGMLQRSLASSFPSEKVKDIALSSFPGNPFCFEFFSAGEEPKTKRYVVRHGVVSRWPGMVKCPVLTLSRTAPMQREAKRLTLSTGKVVGPFEVYRQSLDGLQRMAQQNCRVRAVLQFIRIPYWKQEKQQMMIGDFRFDRRPGDDFSDFRFPNVPRSCPSLLPPWVPPVKAHGFSVQLRSR